MSLLRRVGSRLARFVAAFILVTFFTTVLIDLVPGSPALYMAGEGATPETVEAINETYHFNDPVVVRYGRWLRDLVTEGDLGTSYQTRAPVRDTVSERLPVTFELAVLSLVATLALAVPLAVAAARRPGGVLDRAVGAASSVMISIPAFALALLSIYLFAFQLQLFPLFGWTKPSVDLGENLRSAVLPVVSMMTAQVVIITRVLRADLIQTLQQDYIALARSKGLSTRAVLWKHALRPSSFSLLTLSGVAFGAFLGGAVVVESIFMLPGTGLLLFQSVASKDLVTTQGVVALFAISYLLINLIVDLLYGVLDPRTRRSA